MFARQVCPKRLSPTSLNNAVWRSKLRRSTSWGVAADCNCSPSRKLIPASMPSESPSSANIARACRLLSAPRHAPRNSPPSAPRRTTSDGSGVRTATTPPTAELPYSADAGPCRTSTPCTILASTKSRVAFEKLPLSNWSESGTPSTRIATRLPPMPRILIPSVPKRVPAAS